MTADSDSLQPKKCLFFFKKWNQRNLCFLSASTLMSLLSLKSQYCPRQNSQTITCKIWIFLNVAVATLQSVFHPELPVIPKPGEFKTLFIWKKTAYETQQKANNNLHFLLDSMLLDFSTSYKLAFEVLSEYVSWVNTSVNADSLLHFSEKSCYCQGC